MRNGKSLAFWRFVFINVNYIVIGIIKTRNIFMAIPKTNKFNFNALVAGDF